MTHDRLVELRKALEKNSARPRGRAAHENPKPQREGDSSAEVSLGTILRRNHTYDRGE